MRDLFLIKNLPKLKEEIKNYKKTTVLSFNGSM